MDSVVEGDSNDGNDCPCPICLDTMTTSESFVYPLPCLRCDYNFCSSCVENFCKAAEDDYQIASDGSRQVKITVSCPQCRSSYPLTDLEDTVLLLRNAHELSASILEKVETITAAEDNDGKGVEESKEDMTELPDSEPTVTTKYRMMRDSELSSSQLARKSEFESVELREQLEEAALLYENAVSKSAARRDDEPARARRDTAKEMWRALLDQLPVEPDNVCTCVNPDNCDGSCGCRNSIEVVLQPSGSFGSAKDPTPKESKKSVMDETLFQGFDEFINKDEKVFLTDLFTDGDVRSVVQAALIMNGVRRLALSGNHMSISNQNEPPKSRQEIQQHLDHIDQMKIQFPLPNHMPGYFLIPTYSYWEGYMTLKDKPWDGTMTPPQRSKRVFEHVYGKHYQRPREKEEYPLTVTTVQAVKGPIGRLGLRRDDIITHVDDTEWHGTAEELQDYIYQCHAKHPRNEISITVNVTPETCEFLRVRNELMTRRQLEQRERAKQQALIRKAHSR